MQKLTLWVRSSAWLNPTGKNASATWCGFLRLRFTPIKTPPHPNLATPPAARPELAWANGLPSPYDNLPIVTSPLPFSPRSWFTPPSAGAYARCTLPRGRPLALALKSRRSSRFPGNEEPHHGNNLVAGRKISLVERYSNPSPRINIKQRLPDRHV
jgi:hypothetical protein